MPNDYRDAQEVLAEVVAAVADADGLPEDTPCPTWAELAAWYAAGDCPPDAAQETAQRLWDLTRLIDRSGLASLVRRLVANVAELAGEVSGAVSELADEVSITQLTADEVMLEYSVLEYSHDAPGALGAALFTHAVPYPIGGIAQAWEAADPKTRPAFPLTPLIRAWVTPAVPPDKRRYAIASGAVFNRESQQPAPDRLPGVIPDKLSDFGPHVANPHLPGLEPDWLPSSTTPLAIFDGSGLESLTRGNGAALALRLWLEAMMSAPVQSRAAAPARWLTGNA